MRYPQRNRIASRLRTGLAVLLGVALAGCAVVTVDVDVYKGPLANSHATQRDQTISLAMGAKPLLIQLRDHLEVPDVGTHVLSTRDVARSDGPPKDTYQERLAAFRRRSGYVAGFMTNGPARLTNELAVQVNEILGLYEDRDESSLARELSRLQAGMRRYAVAAAVFRPDKSARGKRVWEKLQPSFISRSGDPLQEAWRALLVPRLESVPLDSGGEVKELWRDEVAIFTNRFNLEMAPGLTNSVAEVERFRVLLEDDAFLEANAVKLFGPAAGPAKGTFKAEVREVAQSYIDAREALHDMLRASLRIINEISTDSRLTSADRARALAAAADVTARLLNEETLDRILPSRAGLSAALLRISKSVGSSKPTASISGIQLSEREQEIARVLREDTNAALELMALDSEIVRSDAPADPFGLGLSPYDDDTPGKRHESRLLPTSGNRGLETLSQALGVVLKGPFGRGRPSDGLETIIERYFEAAARSPGNRETPESAALDSSLVNFAEKIAVLGNFAPLFGKEGNRQATEYVRVLQAIGNSIIVQEDELRRWSAHEHGLTRRMEGTRQALVDAGFTNPAIQSLGTIGDANSAKDVVEQLETVLRAEYAQALREEGIAPGGAKAGAPGATNLPPATVAKTGEKAGEKAEDGAAGDNPARRSTSLLKAIEAVTEMRRDLLYLRPASAYLRSSFPASTLSKSGAQGWRNMLAEHGLRQAPVLNFLSEKLSDRAEAATILRELDGQSWQNVNRVRVAGSGNVNYAIVKDDIGNWYVKSYGADASQIYRSAIGLGVAAGGGAFAPDLFRQLSSTNNPIAATNPPATGPLEKQFKAVAGDFTNAVTRADANLRTEAAGLGARISAGWSEGISDTAVVANLDKIRADAFDPALNRAVTNSATDGAALIRSLLTESAKLEDVLRTKIRDKGQLGTATNAVRSVVGPFVRDQIAARRKLLETYATELGVVQKGLGR